MAITFTTRSVVNINSPDSVTGRPKSDQYLDFIDDTTGETIFTIAHASDGTATAEVDASQCVTEDTVSTKKAEVTLTDAQIKALPTTAINILPAPGAGMVNLVHGALFRSDFTAGAYTNLSATAFLNVVWDAANNYINATVSTDTSERDTLFGADTCLVYCPAYVLLAVGITSPVGFVRATGEFGEIVNTTVDVGAGNGVSGNFTGGNAANTLKVTVYYSPIEV